MTENAVKEKDNGKIKIVKQKKEWKLIFELVGNKKSDSLNGCLEKKYITLDKT
jgi:hypothetical protein